MSAWAATGRGVYVVVVQNNGSVPVVYGVSINRSAPIGVVGHGVVFTNPPVVYSHSTGEFRLKG